MTSKRRTQGKLSEIQKAEIAHRRVTGETKPKVVQTYIRVPRELHDAAQICAQRSGLSLTGFIVQALAARVRTWRDPVYGTKVIDSLVEAKSDLRWEGWICTHGSHGSLPASECPQRSSRLHQKEMYHEELGILEWQDLSTLVEADDDATS